MPNYEINFQSLIYSDNYNYMTEKFVDLIRLSEDSACGVWAGRVDVRERPVFMFGKFQRYGILARNLYWTLMRHKGGLDFNVPAGMALYHVCDTPRCVLHVITAPDGMGRTFGKLKQDPEFVSCLSALTQGLVWCPGEDWRSRFKCLRGSRKVIHDGRDFKATAGDNT